MRFKITLLFSLLIVCCLSATAQTKRLKVSANHRFFTDEKGAPFFWLGDTGWLTFAKLTREEAETYLEDRKQKGFNVIQAMVLHTVAAANVYGDSALVNKNVAKPLTTSGSKSTDTTQYDYWDHVDYVIDLAAKKNIYMALVPVWGTNVKNGWVNRDDAKTYAAWLANRYKGRWNIVWLNGGDIRGSDSMETWKTIGAALKAADPKHLVTFHPFGRTTSSTWFHNEPWLDFNMFQSGHRSYDLDTSLKEHRFGPDNYKFLAIDYNLQPVKPSFDGEPSYELIPHGLHDTTKPYWQADDVRRYAYWNVFAGGAGHTYGHNSVMQMHKPTDSNSAYGSKKYWDVALNDAGAKQMIHLKSLMLSKPYFDRVPDQTLIVDGQGEKYDYIIATRGKDYAFVYTYTGREFEVNTDSLAGEWLLATWFNPRNGSRQPIMKFKKGGSKLFDPPGKPADGNDWVLILETVK